MSILTFLTAEKYTTNALVFSENPEWSTIAVFSNPSSRDIFGFPDEKWFPLSTSSSRSGTTPRKHYSFSSNDHTKTEYEFSFIQNFASNATFPDSTVAYRNVWCCIRSTDNTPGLLLANSQQNDVGVYLSTTEVQGTLGNEVFLDIRASDSTWATVNAGDTSIILPDFELVPDGVYHWNIRLATGTPGTATGKFELWCNNKLMHSDYAINFAVGSFENPARHTEIFTCTKEPNDTYIKSLVVHDAWTSLQGVAPPLLNAIILDEVTATSSINYGFVGTGIASIDEALNDDDKTTYAGTTTSNSNLVLNLTNVPLDFVNNDVAYIKFDAEMFRHASEFSNPVVTLSDTSTNNTYVTINRPVNTVGDVNRTIISAGAGMPVGIKPADIQLTINSGT